jgi:hypothetical protein
VAIEEKDGAECLIPLAPPATAQRPRNIASGRAGVGGGCYLLVCGKINNVFLDFGHTHFRRMPFLMIQDIALAPIDIGLFGAVGIMLGADRIAKLVEQFFIFIRRGWTSRRK